MNTETNYAAAFYSETDHDTAVLEKNVIDYPSSSVARFLLLYHYKRNNDPRFEEFAKQTGMYLNNPLWAQYQLSGAEEPNGFANDINTENKELPKAVNEGKSENLILDANPIREETLFEERPNAENSVTVAEIAPDENNDNSLSEIKDITVEQKLTTEEFPAPVNEQKNENFILGIEPIQENKEEDSERQTNEAIYEQEELLPANTTTDDANSDSLSENLMQAEPIQKSSNQNESSSEIKNEIKEEGFAGDPAENEMAESDDEDPEVGFEPLHTVDYFASQGIKIPEEALENDALGKQVKSFTAWLKTMKKLHPGQLPAQNDVIEKIIQASSEVSNQSANILTEAMAEVLVKQGKREKAIEMYQKLSLLNPSKSAYFAAKIESLKID